VNYHIKQPKTGYEFKSYYHLRWQLLRAPWNQPQGSEVDDIEDQCFHVMAIDSENNVIAVARLQFNSDTEAQIRYMAVYSSYQRQGIGRDLITTMETQATAASCKKIVLDAREPAVGFYQKLGYTLHEKSYLLFDEIQHYRMSKAL